MANNYSLERLLREFPQDDVVAKINIIGAHERGRRTYSVHSSVGRYLDGLTSDIRQMQRKADEDDTYLLPYFKARAEIAGLADAAIDAGNQDFASRAYQMAGI